MDKQAHLIDGDGSFNAVGLDNFIKQVKLKNCGLSYAVVAIMGPQSSGKSTLLNRLFNTNFKEMNALTGRSQTTKGVWIARCVGIEPCTIVMDLEGTDGRERGEDDTSFERQSALFALAVSDIVLINMWCHDIGREKAANKPLLGTVFQVMLKLFSPRKTTLMFVIRDKTKTALENLEPILREDIQKIWDSVPKPEAHRNTPLSEFFNVKVVALSSYEGKEEVFKEQVASLRQKFFHSIAPGGLAGDRRGVVPASGFSFSAQQIWKVIKENKDLDLPAHKVMVATVRCEEIANEKYSSFVADEDWVNLEEAGQSNRVPGFGNKLSSLFNKCLSSYDEEAMYFEDSVRSAKRKQLEEKLLQLVQPACQLMLEHIRSGTLDNFKEALNDEVVGGQMFAVAALDCRVRFENLFDEECEDAVINEARLDSARIRDKFLCDLESYISRLEAAILSEVTAIPEKELEEALNGPVKALLEGACDATWPAIRELVHIATERAVFLYAFGVAGFQVDEQDKQEMIAKMKSDARKVVEQKTREEAAKALYHMKERFTSSFNHDTDSMPRVWSGKEDIRAITMTAWSSTLKVLSVLAAIRLDENTSDTIGDTLIRALVHPTPSQDPLASTRWEGVPAMRTVLTPLECKSLWIQFQKDTEYIITQAVAVHVREANKRNNNRLLPPPWVIVVMVVLGLNGFMTLLRNPLWLLVIIVSWLLAKALWDKLALLNSRLPGILSLVMATIINLLRNLADQGETPPPQTFRGTRYSSIASSEATNENAFETYQQVII